MTTTNHVYYLRTHGGLDTIRVAGDSISLQENDFGHADWCLETSLLPGETRENVHRFCAARGIAAPDWSVMATRQF